MDLHGKINEIERLLNATLGVLNIFRSEMKPKSKQIK